MSVDGAKQKFLACYFVLVLHYICLSVGNINKSSSVYLNYNFTGITMDSPKDIANFQPFFLLVWPFMAQINPILNNLWMVLKQIYWFILIWYMKHDYCQGQDFDWLNYKNVSENFKPTFAWSIILTVMVSVLIASMNSWHT